MADGGEARGKLEALIEAHRDSIADVVAREYKAGLYPNVDLDRLKRIVLVGIDSLVADLGDEEPHRYAAYLASGAKKRVRVSFTTSDATTGGRVLGEALRDFCHQHFADPAERYASIERINAILDTGRDAVLEGFIQGSDEVLREQLEIVRQLSSPIIRVYTGVLVLPLVGQVDAWRGHIISESLLTAISRERASTVIIDITGVRTMEASVAEWLTRAARSARLLGARIIIVGMSPDVARAVVESQLDLHGIVTLADLKAGLEHALDQRGLVIARRPPSHD